MANGTTVTTKLMRISVGEASQSTSFFVEVLMGFCDLFPLRDG
ncbi:MAG: hypothetical protein NZ937_03520 [Armatimonadetes bacterium]|nr:hypothetical protein [Armatimonadota bacterium]